MQYWRANTPGATYFFTLVTHHRHPIFWKSENIDVLREAFRYVIKRHPFKIDGIVILPDHLHTLWTLPDNDANFSTRWRLIKSYFSRNCPLSNPDKITASRKQKGERAIWQRRF
ncbi:transposase [Roseofilum sp. BLCC_M114]|uniref:Transposase n=1 Tax=Roseofilum capinflatum BLCC-M114 TaxID=3022440 RepID=A0ABT7B147_9CYAN|nr:transposase [Roseofilum capinflatum]MDJ1172856.1 transposase [Roseofilum capinflatum BLCC-M114]